MKKCVYCLRTESQVNFTSEEHVIPQSLGGKTFPVIIGLVCDECNSKTLSKLETGFKQDSIEGVFAQMFGINDSQSVWIRGKNIDITTVSGFGDKFFDEIFPFLKIENNIPVIDFKSQLKVRNYNSGFQIFPYETLLEIRNANGRKFEEIKERLLKVSLKDMAVFAGSDDGSSHELDEFINLMKDYGINYKERERKFEPNLGIKDKTFEVGWNYKIDANLMRVIAKIAFNYFIYCTVQEGDSYINFLFKNNFDEIRNFIYKGEGDWRKIVNVTNRDVILTIESDKNQRAIAHVIYFTLKDGIIMASVSLFGKIIYEVIIGKYPLSLIQNNFGCGHVFEPFEKIVLAISAEQFSINRMVDKGYGWFKI